MVKDKPNSTRIYDGDGYRRRAACVCVKDNDQNQILLVSSSNEPNGWIIPGGGLEPEEEPSQTATREVLEEAGVSGRLGNCLGIFEVVVFTGINELSEWDDSRTIGILPNIATSESLLSYSSVRKETSVVPLRRSPVAFDYS